jgi:hypothetical protein
MMNEDQQAPAVHRPHHGHNSAIVSGDSLDEHGDIFDETDEEETAMYRMDPSNPANKDDLYDANLDEEDEVYVYKHLRGGVQENLKILSQQQQQQQQQQDTKTIKVYKPRTSDAVLSCPCCFNIVCMDCQRHQQYLNQFRAMFVMGISVDWHSRLVYDEVQQVLVPKPELPNQQVPPEETDFLRHDAEGEYFSVLCANCQTQVAALDMNEELYHFHGCLESA